ncbi:hypothetical protein CIT292_08281 [Citrobacter youngae ATCC 29220]|uniref:Uncharacterized protein n=1 Tax=Citrobacter youngae ATCC 29220 TaxID=500640 RepID=D4BCR7_9ENTR|nr:hypothetical protein CIT292_08281 [Citrobacter youngae ATCC 29220]
MDKRATPYTNWRACTGRKKNTYGTVSLIENSALPGYSDRLNNCNSYILNKFPLRQKKASILLAR